MSVQVVKVQVIHPGERSHQTPQYGVCAMSGSIEVWHLTAATRGELARDVGVRHIRDLANQHELMRWLVAQGQLDHHDAVDMFGYSDPRADGTRLVGRVYEDEAAIEQTDDEGDPPTDSR